MADLTQMAMSAAPLAAAPGTELGMGVPGMPPPQLHHEHNGPQEPLPDSQQPEGLGQENVQPMIGTEDVVKLFGFITSEFRGFLAHVESAVQVQPLPSSHGVLVVYAWQTGQDSNPEMWQHLPEETQPPSHVQLPPLLLMLLLLLYRHAVA